MSALSDHTYVSGAMADSSCVFVRIAAGFAVAVRFHDDGSLRDVTEWLPDLIATGLIAQSRRAIGLDGSPKEVVTVADVELLHVPSGEAGLSLDEDILPIVPEETSLQAWIVSPAQRTTDRLGLAELFAAAAEGVAAMVLDAVASAEAEQDDVVNPPAASTNEIPDEPGSSPWSGDKPPGTDEAR